jgi:hypothetical protein
MWQAAPPQALSGHAPKSWPIRIIASESAAEVSVKSLGDSHGTSNPPCTHKSKNEKSERGLVERQPQIDLPLLNPRPADTMAAGIENGVLSLDEHFSVEVQDFDLCYSSGGRWGRILANCTTGTCRPGLFVPTRFCTVLAAKATRGTLLADAVGPQGCAEVPESG